MRSILRKELKLSTLLLTYFFIAFGLLFFIPGYPILCSAFFVTLGIYQSFRWAVESNDIVFSALLPIAKKDVVRGKFAITCLIELCSFTVMLIATLIRMTVLADASVYRQNALMNANGFALGMVLLISLISFQLIAEHELKVKGKARMAAAAAEYAEKHAKA